jgi:YVTN family beta-propeller protein
VVFNPTGNRAYVTNQTDQTVSVVNVKSSHEIGTIPLGHSAFNLLVFSRWNPALRHRRRGDGIRHQHVDIGDGGFIFGGAGSERAGLQSGWQPALRKLA